MSRKTIDVAAQLQFAAEKATGRGKTNLENQALQLVGVAQHRSKAKIVDQYSTTNEGRMKEQQNIDNRGGVDQLDNKRNEIAPDKRIQNGLSE